MVRLLAEAEVSLESYLEGGWRYTYIADGVL